MSSYVEGKDKNQILKEMYTTAQPGSVVHEQQKAAIMVRCTEDLEKAIITLKNRITILDIVLAAATIVGALATMLMALKMIYA